LKGNPTNKQIFKDKNEFRSFFNSYYPSLRQFAYNIVFDNSIAEDLVQEAFIRLWEKNENFYNEQSAKSFLYTSLKNSCINPLDHTKVIKKHEDITKHQSFNSAEINNRIIEEETHRLIYNAINELPSQCKNILLLSMNGLKNSEIAQELDISQNTVKTQKKIAYRQLKLKLKDI
jgi:RNA polymerase sigma-70 factor (family 1)